MVIFWFINFSSMLHNSTLQIGFLSYLKNYIAFLKKKIILIVLIELNFLNKICINQNFIFNHQNLYWTQIKTIFNENLENLRAQTWWA